MLKFEVEAHVMHLLDEVVEGPAPAPNGARLIARHPDGAVFEYIETGGAVPARQS